MYCIKKIFQKTKQKSGLLAMIVMAVTASLSGCSRQEQLVSESGMYFDTSIQIQVADKNGKTLLRKCFSICKEMEDTFSATNPDSELYQVNHRDTNQLEISDDLAEAITVGLEYGEKTNGVFDITIRPLAELWDFRGENPTVPDEAAIQEALAKVDYRKVSVADNTLTFENENIMLDLGGLAKGYIADRLKDYLVENNVKSAMINLGGNVLAIGNKPDGTPWNVGVQRPYAQRNDVLSVQEITDQTVVSAGTYERYFEEDGKVYHHVLDPRTGYPADSGLDQVTFVLDNSTQADILSTTCLILGTQESGTVLAEDGISNTWLHLTERCVMIKQ